MRSPRRQRAAISCAASVSASAPLAANLRFPERPLAVMFIVVLFVFVLARFLHPFVLFVQLVFVVFILFDFRRERSSTDCSSSSSSSLRLLQKSPHRSRKPRKLPGNQILLSSITLAK